MKNSKWVYSIAILIAITGLAIVGIGYGLRPASDEQMIADFYTHRNVFEQLKQMSFEDGQNMSIGADGTYWYAQAFGPGVSETRRHEYQELLRQAGIVQIAGGGKSVALSIPGRFLPISSMPPKGYLFTATAPSWLTTEDTSAYTFSPGQEPVLCRPIEENWYICIDDRD